MINSVFQDSFGFLWMASTEGLIRWDGYNYKTYYSSENNKFSLSNNIVYRIFEDSKQRLWIATIDGLNLYDREMDRFLKCKINGDIEKVPVNDIIEGPEGDLWLGTSYGLCRYNFDKQSYIWYLNNPESENSLSNDVIFGLASDTKGNIWVATFAGGVSRFSPADQKFTNYFHQKGNSATICSNKIRSIMVDHDDNVWVGSYDRGISLLSNDGTLLHHYKIADDNEEQRDQNLVISIYEDQNNNIWIAAEKEQLNYLDKELNKLQEFKQPVYKKNKKGCRSISSFYEDSFGNFWFSSSEYGLYYTNHNKNSFRHFSVENAISKELGNNTITSFHESASGTVWIGTDGGGITAFDKEEKAFKNYSGEEGLNTGVIIDIQEDKHGILWLASTNGIIRFDPRKEVFKSYTNDPADPESLIYNNVKSLLIEDSIIWIGTFGRGLSFFNINTEQFTHQLNNESLPFDMSRPSWINHLFRDSRNRIWISTYSGLFMYDREKLNHFAHSESVKSISGNSVHMVTEDAKSRIWVASESGGLDLFNEEDQTFVRYDSNPNLPGSFKGVVVDDHGKLWLSSNEGLVVFDPETNYVHVYDVSEGIQGNSFFVKSVMKSKSGRLYFGGFNGFNVFHPDSINAVPAPVDFYFTDLYIYDALQQPEDDNSVLSKPLQFTDTLTLSYSQAYFSLGFSAINLYAPLETEYSYKLKNFGNKWLNLKGERKVTFYNLEPGSYIFQVRYKGADGNWVQASKELNIVILPPWWQTLWFKLFVFSIIVAVILLFFYQKLAAVKKQKDILAAEVRKRTLELSEANKVLLERNEEVFTQNEKLEISNIEIKKQADKILNQQHLIVSQNHELEKTVDELRELNVTKDHFVSILAHDLKNPISALTGISEFLKDNFTKMDKKDVYEYIDGIHRSSGAVYDLLLNLLTWSMAQSGKIEFEPTEININTLINKNALLFEQQSANKNIQLQIVADKEYYGKADYNMLDTVIRNLISNSIKFTDYNGKVVISLEETEENLLITVSDNGTGMTPGQIEYLFQVDKNKIGKGTAGESGTGLGLAICRDFIQKNNGSIEVESEKGVGTTFRMSIQKVSAKEISRGRIRQKINTESGGGYDLNFWEELPMEKMLQLKGKKILIVDDSPEQRMFLKTLLYEKFEIIEAENGNEGMRLALERKPTAIISDVMMPEVDGIEFCKLLRNDPNTSLIPVILLTSQTGVEHQVSGYAAGADLYLNKPVRKDLLLQVLLNCIQNQEKLNLKLLELPGALPETANMNKHDEEFINKLIDFIEQELSNPEIDSWVIAEAIGVSRTILYERVKALTGKTLNDFIKSIRLKKSLRLLAEGKLSNSQIAFEVGFSSHSYFAKCFVKEFGVSPSKYVAQKQKGAVIQK